MGLLELLLTAIGLSMDAFAVSVTNGLSKKNVKLKRTFLIALTFGVFQGVMPTLGYFLGQTFTSYVQKYDHIIALVLLGFIGGKMLYDAFCEDDKDDNTAQNLTIGVLLVQGIATSIDALAVGVSFSALNVNIVTSALFITVTTFIFSFAGVFIGKAVGSVLNKKATIIGGLILIAIGLKIFIEHTFFC